MLSIFAFLNWIPWQPNLIPNELDGSWGLALQWAAIHHADFGHQLVMTFGPWGFIWQGALAGTLGQIICAWFGLTAVFLAGLTAIAQSLVARSWHRAIWLAAIVTLSSLPVELVQDVRLFAIVWLMLFVHLYGERISSKRLNILKVALSVAAAFVSLVKFSIAVLAFPVLVIVCLNELLRRRFPWALIAYIGSFFIFWFLAHQHLAALWPYLRHSMLISSGYAQGAAVSTPDELRQVLQFVALGIWLCVGVATSQRVAATPQESEPSYMPIVRGALAVSGIVIAIFLAFKAGYVRHDEHQISATLALAILSILYLPVLWRSFQRTTSRRSLCVLVALCLILLNNSLDRFAGNSLPGQIEVIFDSSPSQALAVVHCADGQHEIEPQFAALRSQSRFAANLNLPPFNGGIDEFGFKQWMLIARGLDYRPRPVMNLYVSYTPEISKLNADFLASPSACANLLFDIAPIDGHYPTIEDSLAWPQVIGAYAPAGDFPGFLWLHHRPRSLTFSFTPLRDFDARFGEQIQVPASTDCVWASVQIDLTPLGHILQVVYKNAPIEMQVKTADGRSGHARLILRMARAGFILSPLILSRSTFAAVCTSLKAPSSAQTRVTEITLRSQGSPQEYDATYHISFSGIRYSSGPITQPPALPLP